MKSVVVIAAVLSLSACGDDGGEGSWPNQLYLALLGSERAVQLVELEPAPF